MAGNPNFNLEVVVNGPQVTVAVNPQQKIEQLIREALRKARQPHEGDISAWQLRSEHNVHFADPGQKIGDAGIVAGVKLFLNKDAGGGG